MLNLHGASYFSRLTVQCVIILLLHGRMKIKTVAVSVMLAVSPRTLGT